MKKIALTKLHKRLISGFILAPIVLGVLIVDGVFLLALLVFTFSLSVFEWLRMAAQGGRRLTDSAFGLLYLGVSFLSFYLLRSHLQDGLFLSLALFLSVWSSDTGAYLAGKVFNGPKMWPSVSPNKTWSGLGGAMFFCALMLVLCFYAANFFPVALSPSGADYIFLVVAGAAFGVLGQGGDLLVSAFKRRIGVKDTGGFIPGHGGLLDRIDALLLVCPCFTAVMWVWMLT